MSRVSTSIRSDNFETLTAARVLGTDDNGKRFFLSAAAGFQITLPAPELGFEFEAIIKTSVTSNGYTVVTQGSANVLVGQGSSADLNAASDVDLETSGGDTFTFVANKAVKGDSVRFVSDGTSWYAQWFTTAFDAATITTAS